MLLLHGISMRALLVCLSLAVAAPAQATVSEYERQAVSYNETLQLRDAATRLRLLGEIETAFLNDYGALWGKEGMSDRLSSAIDRAFAGVLGKG